LAFVAIDPVIREQQEAGWAFANAARLPGLLQESSGQRDTRVKALCQAVFLHPVLGTL
jgi:hypothetical protein